MVYLTASSDSAMLDRWRTALGEDAAVVETRRFELLSDCLSRLQPKLALLDLRLLPASRLKAIAALRKAHPGTAVVAFVEESDDEQELALLRLGVRGVCLLELPPDTLIKAVSAVSRGEVWVRRSLVATLLENVSAEPLQLLDHPPGQLAVLTPREAEIVQLLGTGSSNKRIAQQLTISERTVKGHLTAIFRKTGVMDRVKLALLVARRH